MNLINQVIDLTPEENENPQKPANTKIQYENSSSSSSVSSDEESNQQTSNKNNRIEKEDVLKKCCR